MLSHLLSLLEHSAGFTISLCQLHGFIQIRHTSDTRGVPIEPHTRIIDHPTHQEQPRDVEMLWKSGVTLVPLAQQIEKVLK